MAIQPIDLQTMYSQMSNVANRVSHEQQSAQIAQGLQQQSAVNQNTQKIQTVNKTAGEEEKTGNVKEDGHNETENRNSDKKKKPDQNTAEPNQNQKIEIREDYLGHHINIER